MTGMVVSRREIKYIKTRAAAGQTAEQISAYLEINLERVKVFMPKDPELEKAEANARSKARAETREREENATGKMELNKRAKRKAREEVIKEDARAAAAASI